MSELNAEQLEVPIHYLQDFGRAEHVVLFLEDSLDGLEEEGVVKDGGERNVLLFEDVE